MSGLGINAHNGQSLKRADVPILPTGVFRGAIIDAVNSGARISAMFVMPNRDGAPTMLAALSDDEAGMISLMGCNVGDSFESLTPDCPQAHMFEREIYEQFAITPQGHPWLKPVRFAPAMAGGAAANQAAECGRADFFRVAGPEIHEVAVGPVHAGVIEPGHFRFQCYGEEVLHLEISLGYQHRGVESAMVGAINPRMIHLMEAVAGDTTIGHAMAYCRAIEYLARSKVSPRAQAIRGIALELERVANHIGDLGAIAGDVGFLPTQSFCGRIRGDVLNATAVICGNRFGRSLVRCGGVTFDIDDAIRDDLLRRIDGISRDAAGAINLLWDTPSAMARYEDVGTVPFEVCVELGLVGPAARACGCSIDVRKDMPFGIFRFTHIPTATLSSGDVFARAYIRWMEIQHSLAFAREQLQSLPAGKVMCECKTPEPDRIVVSMTEGWRGEICHVVVSDEQGGIARYKVVDPSFHNWAGLAYALRGQQISDFPLCNKSFNLSYCGHDL